MVKNPPANAGNRLDPWVEKIPWRRKWQPTPVFLHENPMDRGAWWVTDHGITKSDTDLACTHIMEKQLTLSRFQIQTT